MLANAKVIIENGIISVICVLEQAEEVRADGGKWEINLSYDICSRLAPKKRFIYFPSSRWFSVAHKSIKTSQQLFCFFHPLVATKENTRILDVCYGARKNSWEIIKILVYDITFRLMVKFIDFLLLRSID